VAATLDASALVGIEPNDRVRMLTESQLDGVAEAYGEIIDAKSPFTYQHSRRVAEISRSLGAYFGRPPLTVQQLYRAGLLHDVGKLGVSNRILDKPGKLTDRELESIRQHPRFTMEILQHVRAFSDLARTAALHHERLDGRGYPWGLNADHLDPDSRVLAVADVFEALTADRPYRAGLPVERALEMLGKDAGLDGNVVDALTSCVGSERALVTV
jgi:HD-GYP domain-containing protein (c-di-GMP phosphodiesterase class II)